MLDYSSLSQALSFAFRHGDEDQKFRRRSVTRFLRAHQKSNNCLTFELPFRTDFPVSALHQAFLAYGLNRRLRDVLEVLPETVVTRVAELAARVDEQPQGARVTVSLQLVEDLPSTSAGLRDLFRTVSSVLHELRLALQRNGPAFLDRDHLKREMHRWVETDPDALEGALSEEQLEEQSRLFDKAKGRTTLGMADLRAMNTLTFALAYPDADEDDAFMDEAEADMLEHASLAF